MVDNNQGARDFDPKLSDRRTASGDQCRLYIFLVSGSSFLVYLVEDFADYMKTGHQVGPAIADE